MKKISSILLFVVNTVTYMIGLGILFGEEKK